MAWMAAEHRMLAQQPRWTAAVLPPCGPADAPLLRHVRTACHQAAGWATASRNSRKCRRRDSWAARVSPPSNQRRRRWRAVPAVLARRFSSTSAAPQVRFAIGGLAGRSLQRPAANKFEQGCWPLQGLSGSLPVFSGTPRLDRARWEGLHDCERCAVWQLPACALLKSEGLSHAVLRALLVAVGRP